jgi:hypothetical protein
VIREHEQAVDATTTHGPFGFDFTGFEAETLALVMAKPDHLVWFQISECWFIHKLKSEYLFSRRLIKRLLFRQT